MKMLLTVQPAAGLIEPGDFFSAASASIIISSICGTKRAISSRLFMMAVGDFSAVGMGDTNIGYMN
jgi:hypothetical protein